MRYETTVIEVCTVCLCLMANGEYNDGTDAADACLRGMRELWGDDVRHMIAGCSDDGEPGYSTQSCEGCGDWQHGDRHIAYVMVPLPLPVATFDGVRMSRTGRRYTVGADGAYVEVRTPAGRVTGFITRRENDALTFRPM